MGLPTPAEIQYMSAHINDSKVGQILATNIACTLIALLAITLRFGSRRLIKADRKADDWLIIIALVFSVAFAMSYVALTKYGGGRHAILVTNPKAVAQIYLCVECFYCTAVVSIKMSILFLYHRIFIQPWFRVALKLTGALIMAWGITSNLVNIFQCWPISFQWNPTEAGHCIDYAKSSLVFSVVNIITDFVILGLPMPLVWQLKVSKRSKLALSATFAAGCLACVISIVRLAFIEQVSTSYDQSWDDIESGLLSTAELCVGIFAACIPTYRPLFEYAFGGCFGRSTKLSYPSRLANGSKYGRGQTDQLEMTFPSSRGTERNKNWVQVTDDDEQRFVLPPHDP